jgi:hypothetical protein
MSFNEYENVSIHYITNDSKKIIQQIARREHKCIDDYYMGIELEKSFQKAFEDRATNNVDNVCPQRPKTIQEYMEETVIRKWKGVLSVYPILETMWQRENETWVKCDTRKRSSTQKYAAMLFGATSHELHFLMWRSGDLINTWTFDIDIWHDAQGDLTLRKLGSEELISEWLRVLPPGFDFEKPNELLDFRLTLPNNWREQWSLVGKTMFTTVFSRPLPDFPRPPKGEKQSGNN